MNFFLWFGQVGWAQKFHAVSMVLQERMDGFSASGLTFGPALKLFMEKHRHEAEYISLYDVNDLLIDFLKEPIDHEYINRLETAYSQSLWKYIYADRKLISFTHPRRFLRKDYTYEELLKIICGMFKFFESEFEKLKIDCLVMYGAASAWALVAYDVAIKLGIKYRVLRSIEFPEGRALWSDNPFDHWGLVEQRYNEFMQGSQIDEQTAKESQFLIKEYQTKKPIHHRLKRKDESFASLKSLFNINKINNVIKPFVHYYLNERKNTLPPIDIRLSQWIQAKVSRHFLLRHKNRFFEHPKDDEIYAFFPLHLEPEATLMIWALDYVNQVALIEQIARMLPVSWKLYVKEHPNMVGRRPIRVYRHLKKIPNIRLIDPTIPAIDLIENSRLVLTITGTVGWESVLLKRPVITFGSVFYNLLPMVKPVKCVQEVRDAIGWAENNYEYDENVIECFMAAKIIESFELSSDYHWKIGEDWEKNQWLKKQTTIVAESLLESL